MKRMMFGHWNNQSKSSFFFFPLQSPRLFYKFSFIFYFLRSFSFLFKRATKGGDSPIQKQYMYIYILYYINLVFFFLNSIHFLFLIHFFTTHKINYHTPHKYFNFLNLFIYFIFVFAFWFSGKKFDFYNPKKFPAKKLTWHENSTRLIDQ